MIRVLQCVNDYPNFRSSRTGYTYADLCDIYSDFKKYTIPALYAYVLNGPQVRDGTVLQEYLANTIETAKQNEQITTEQRDSLWSLTDQYRRSLSTSVRLRI